MTVRIQKPAVNIREKLAELERPIGINGQALLATDTPQQAFDLLGARNRNRIINGDMRIDQRNAGASLTVSTDPQYTVDRWIAGRATVPNFTIIRSATSPVGFTSSLLATMGTGTSPGSGGYAYIGQKIEGFNTSDLLWGTANAKPITLSFWANCSVVGTFGVSFRNNSADTTYCNTYTINSTNTWEYKTVTIPGVTTGTWFSDNRSGIEIFYDLGVGTLYSGTAGQVNSGANYFGVTGTTKLSSTTGATFYITGVQLEVGKVATPFEYRSYGQELALCQRYFYMHVSGVSAKMISLASYYSATQIEGFIQFPVTMRTTPTGFSSSGTDYYLAYRNGGFDGFNSIIIPTETTTNSAKWYNTAEASGIAGNVALVVTNSASAYLGFNAEL